VAICARALGIPMDALAVPRRSDLAPYWRVLRLLLAKLRSSRSVAP
jgi:hypothetical protein